MAEQQEQKRKEQLAAYQARVQELQPALDPLIDQLECLLKANDWAGFQILVDGVQCALESTLRGFKKANPKFDETQTIQ